MDRVGVFMRANVFLVVLAAALIVNANASATWSIVAVDEDTGEVGAVVATCFSAASLFEVPGVVPGVGAVVAQAFSDADLRAEALRLMADGDTPAEIIAAITDPSFDNSVNLRQYGVAVLGQMPANFSGDALPENLGTAQQLLSSAFNASAQGNLLRDNEVVEAALEAFEGLGGQVTLADRLVAGLQAGAEAGGDRRCTMEQTALAAVLVVAGPDDDASNPSIRLEVDFETEDANPVTQLVMDYETMFGTIESRENATGGGIGGGGGCATTAPGPSAHLFAAIALALVPIARRRKARRH